MAPDAFKSLTEYVFSRPSSLETRLRRVFQLFLVIGILFVSALMFAQYQVSSEMTQVMVQWNQERVNAQWMRQLLLAMERKGLDSEIPRSELLDFKNSLEKALKIRDREASENFAFLEKIQQSFDIYFQEMTSFRQPGSWRSLRLRKRLASLLESRRIDLRAQVEAFLDYNEHSRYRLAERLQTKQLLSTKLGLLFFFAVILLCAQVGRKLISAIARPLGGLTEFVDKVDLEGELPGELPRFEPELKEISSVAKSFGRLLNRLRGYKDLNIRRLLLERQRTNIIAESISEGILLLHGDEILYMNPIGKRIFNYRVPNEAGTGALRARGAGEARAAEWSVSGAVAIRNAIARSLPVEFDLEEDGYSRHYLIQAYPISSSQAEVGPDPLGVEGSKEKGKTWVVVAQDLTWFRETQQAKGHFLGTLSHEVKTPVTSLTLAIRLLDRMLGEQAAAAGRMPGDDVGGGSSVSGLLRICVEEVDRLRKLLDDFLTVSRLDTMTQKLQLKSINFVKLVRHTIQGFQGLAAERGVTLSSSLPAGRKQLLISVDPSKIAWALTHILTNAIRHTPRGGRVHAELVLFQERVELRVRDTGPGIDQHRQSKIFEKFSQNYDIRIARSGGAGVGLSIAREIIAAHGGRIWVSSEMGAGAEFCFTLPLHQKKCSELDPLTIGEDQSSKGVLSGASACS